MKKLIGLGLGFVGILRSRTKVRHTGSGCMSKAVATPLPVDSLPGTI